MHEIPNPNAAIIREKGMWRQSCQMLHMLGVQGETSHSDTKKGDCEGIHKGLNEILQNMRPKEGENVAAAFAAIQGDTANNPNEDWRICTGLSFAWAALRSTSKQG
jgi:hypothetical protein